MEFISTAIGGSAGHAMDWIWDLSLLWLGTPTISPLSLTPRRITPPGTLAEAQISRPGRAGRYGKLEFHGEAFTEGGEVKERGSAHIRPSFNNLSGSECQTRWMMQHGLLSLSSRHFETSMTGRRINLPETCSTDKHRSTAKGAIQVLFELQQAMANIPRKRRKQPKRGQTRTNVTISASTRQGRHHLQIRLLYHEFLSWLFGTDLIAHQQSAASPFCMDSVFKPL